MASLKKTFDADLVAQIAEEAKKGQAVEAPKEEMKNVEIELKPGEEWFSDHFWKPAHIPDIPVRVFTREEWDENARIMIPESDPNWIWPKETTELFAMAMYCDDTILLHGLQGTGKSQLPEQWGAKFNMPVWRMSCHDQTREEHFVGSVSVAYVKDADGNQRMTIQQEPSILTDSLKHGGIFIEDEAFRHNSALVLQSLREKNTRRLLLPDAPGRTSKERVLQAPKGRWRYILTDNTTGSGDTTGLFQAHIQDASTLDRITTAIEVQYLPAEGEKKIVSKYAPEIPKDVITKMVTFCGKVRTSFGSGGIQSTISVRGLLAWAEKYRLTKDLPQSLRLSWFSKLSPDNKAKVADMFHQVFGEKI